MNYNQKITEFRTKINQQDRRSTKAYLGLWIAFLLLALVLSAAWSVQSYLSAYFILALMLLVIITAFTIALKESIMRSRVAKFQLKILDFQKNYGNRNREKIDKVYR